MKLFLIISIFGFLTGCGDKDEDTGDTGIEDTATEEQLKTAGGHGLQVS